MQWNPDTRECVAHRRQTQLGIFNLGLLLLPYSLSPSKVVSLRARQSLAGLTPKTRKETKGKAEASRSPPVSQRTSGRLVSWLEVLFTQFSEFSPGSEFGAFECEVRKLEKLPGASPKLPLKIGYSPKHMGINPLFIMGSVRIGPDP